MRLALRVVAVLAVVTLSVLPALASDTVITRGSDLWVTPADGSSFTSFELNPLPRGFFCAGSQPFSGKIAFKGAPLATKPLNALGHTDTVVERLDDAYFDRDGIATTRIQLRALSLVGIEPLRNECGEYNVALTLAGDQPTTTMTIVKTRPEGGIYNAPLSLNVRITFTPVAGGEALSVEKRVDLGPAPGARWQFKNASDRPGRRFIGKPFVQLNGLGLSGHDELVPLHTNFQTVTREGLGNVAGANVAPTCIEVEAQLATTSCEDPACHTGDTSSHCTCDGGCTYY